MLTIFLVHYALGWSAAGLWHRNEGYVSCLDTICLIAGGWCTFLVEAFMTLVPGERA